MDLAPAASRQLQPLAFLLIVAGTAFAVAALLVRSPTLLLAAVPLLLAPVAAWGALEPDRGRLGLRWRATITGPDVLIDGEIAAPEGPLGSVLRMELAVPPGLAAVEADRWTREDGGLRFRLHWRAVHPLLVRLAIPPAYRVEPLGLALRPVTLAGEPLLIACFPPEATRIGPVPLPRPTSLPGETPAPALARSGEFFGVRPAGPGDAHRQVNARASARVGRLCVNEFRSERSNDLVIVLDARPTPLGPATDQALFAMARAGAYGLVQGFLDAKNRVGLAVFGESLDSVPLGSGRHQRWRLDTLLTRAEVAAAAGPPERLAVSLLRAFPPGVPTLLVSSLADEEAFSLVPHLRRRGFPTAVLSPSPVPLIAATLSGAAEDALLLRLMRLVRRGQIARAWREAPTLDWESYWQFAGLRGLLRAGRAGARGGLR